MKFKIGDRATLTVNVGIWVPCTIIKVSYTADGVWYGVHIDRGIVIHGVDEDHLRPE